jgi:hypothetical protein
MAQHRFRTTALIGEWRATFRQACEDALRARQARPDERAPKRMIWMVPGEIESDRPLSRAGTPARAPRSL